MGGAFPPPIAACDGVLGQELAAYTPTRTNHPVPVHSLHESFPYWAYHPCFQS